MAWSSKKAAWMDNILHADMYRALIGRWDIKKWGRGNPSLLANLLYGGSLSRFMHVAEVGSRLRSSSEAVRGAALQWQQHVWRSKKEKKEASLKQASMAGAIWRAFHLRMQNLGSRCLNPRSGPLEHPVTNLGQQIRVKKKTNLFGVTTSGWLGICSWATLPAETKLPLQ